MLTGEEKDDYTLLNEKYIYTFVQHIDEIDLSQLEQRAFFKKHTNDNLIISDICVDPSRSAFMRERLDVEFEADTFEDLMLYVRNLDLDGQTFKLTNLNDISFGRTEKIVHKDRRHFERSLGLLMTAEADLDNPSIEYSFITYDGKWYFGQSVKSVSVWRMHMDKPQNYSTALSTRVARTIANVAAPIVEDVKMIDPCCGIGTVIIEALSMNMDIIGRDMSPFVCMGARKNIEHFGYQTTITKGPIQEVQDQYDVAIIDLPYNVFTSASKEQQMDIILHAKRIAKKIIIVTIEPVDEYLTELNMTITDRGTAKKQSFEREILVCH